MKRITVLFCLMLFVISVLRAQNADNKWAIGFDYGTLQYKGDLGDQIFDWNDWKNGYYFSLHRYLNPSFEGVLNLNYNLIEESGPLMTEANRFYGKMFTGELNLRYKFNNGFFLKENSLFQPFIAVGAGYMGGKSSGISYDLGTVPYNEHVGSLDFYYGIGTKIKISDRVSWQVELGEVRITKDDFDEATTLRNGNDFFRRIKTGIVITLGKTKDSDNDGISDKKDQCPGTPVGVKVDGNGCPIDSDGDGVADYLDDCPTIAGVAALKGCPDKDGDGIADKDDDCPDVAGIKEFKGCPDSDADGVADKSDKCPGTPKGWKVDENGCPIDTDGDGIVDEEDACPTVAGVPEEKGCPAKENKKPVQVEEKIEPVYFASDKSYLTTYSKNKLNKLISLLKDNSDYMIEIYGYTDNTADDAHNMQLSQQRIDSVVEYLTLKGIASSRVIKVKAYGESMPAATNDTPEGKQKNRRVEFRIVENGK